MQQNYTKQSEKLPQSQRIRERLEPSANGRECCDSQCAFGEDVEIGKKNENEEVTKAYYNLVSKKKK